MDPIRPPRSGRLLHVIAGILLAIYAGFALAIANDNSPPPSSKSEHSLPKRVMAGGGRPAGDEQYHGNGTLGQSLPVGVASSPNFRLHAGFWAGARLPFSDVPDAGITCLSQNFPNPFNPTTTIPFYLAKSGGVDLAVYDARGRRLRTLIGEFLPSGDHKVVWDGKDAHGRQAASGMYFLRLTVGQSRVVKKMILVK